MSSEIKLNSIGSIKVEKGRFYVSIKREYRSALKGIEGFSHINIIWWGNQSDSQAERDTLLVKKPYKKALIQLAYLQPDLRYARTLF